MENPIREANIVSGFRAAFKTLKVPLILVHILLLRGDKLKYLKISRCVKGETNIQTSVSYSLV